MKVLYSTTATATGGRNGHAETSDGLLKVDLAVPKEMGGAGGKTNPEQLFACGYAACFENAMLHIARMQKIQLGPVTVTATVDLLPGSGGGFHLGVALHADIAGVTQEVAQGLMNVTHQVCPYSNALKGNVDVKLTATAR